MDSRPDLTFQQGVTNLSPEQIHVIKFQNNFVEVRTRLVKSRGKIYGQVVILNSAIQY